MTQFFIFITGVIAIYLSQQKNEHWKKYACFPGLTGQPFWFWETITREQWGLFLLTICYTGVWLLGFKNYWLRGSRDETRNQNIQ